MNEAAVVDLHQTRPVVTGPPARPLLVSLDAALDPQQVGGKALLLEVIKRTCRLQGKLTYRGPHQLAHDRPTAQRMSDIPAQAADVGTGATANLQAQEGVLKVVYFHLVDHDFPR